MKKSLNFFVSLCFLVTIFSLISCATVSREEMANEVKNYDTPYNSDGNNAVVYIVRPSELGTLIRFNVYLDDKEDVSEMGFTRGGQYLYFYVTPGKHKLYSLAENWAEIIIDATAGQKIYVLQEPSMGFVMARNSLENLDEVAGKYYVKKTELGTVKKTVKQ